MQKKTISTIILFAFLSLSLISLISANYDDSYIYAGNGIVVYPTYILKQVCHPFMPCGVERIDIPSQKNYRYNDYDNQETTGQALYRELSTPGFSEVIKDQKSPTYDPLYNSKNYNQQRNKNYNQAVIVYTKPSQNNPTPIKHFANTYNTRNNYDSNGNWIGSNNKNNDVYYQKTNSRTVVIYM